MSLNGDADTATGLSCWWWFAAASAVARLSDGLGRSPVEEFIDSLSDVDAAAVLAGMADVRKRGLVAARHLEGDIWERRVDGDRVGFKKNTQKTPRATIELAKRRLSDWRRRGTVRQAAQGKPSLSR